MKKLSIPLVFLLVCVFVITACGSNQAATTTKSSATTPVSTQPAITTTVPVTSAAPSPPPTTPTASKPSATSPAASTPTQNKYGGTLRIIEPSGPGAPLGAEWENNIGNYPTQQWVMQGLLREQVAGKIVPALAESYDVNSSGPNPNMVFHLRKGVKFIDGTDFNAQAVAWNLDMYKKTGTYLATTNYWKSWDILDDYTIRVNLTQWRNTMIRAWDSYFLVSPTAYNKNGIDWMRTHVVSTAPFMQTDYKQDVSFTAVKNPTYWDAGKPNLNGVQLLYVVDQLTREALFLSGGAEFLNALPSEGPKFASQGFNIITRPSGPNALIPDSKNPDSPYSNIKVRLAVEAAIDRESLASTFGYGYSSAAYQFASPAAMAFDPALASQYRKYDVAKAKQLMADAGYPNGFKTTIEVSPGIDNNPALAIQSYLAKIGIQASLDFPQPARWTVLQNQPVPTSTLFYQPMAEAATFNTTVNVYFADPGSFYWPNLKKADGWPALFAQDLTSPTADPAILKQVSDMFFNDCTIIPLFYNSLIVIVSPKVQDSGIGNYGTLDSWDFPNVWLSK